MRKYNPSSASDPFKNIHTISNYFVYDHIQRYIHLKISKNVSNPLIYTVEVYLNTISSRISIGASVSQSSRHKISSRGFGDGK